MGGVILYKSKLFVTDHFVFNNPEICDPLESITMPSDCDCIAIKSSSASTRSMDGSETHGNCIVWNFFMFRNADTIPMPKLDTDDDVLAFIREEILSNANQLIEYFKYLSFDPNITDILKLQPIIFFFINVARIGEIRLISQHINQNRRF